MSQLPASVREEEARKKNQGRLEAGSSSHSSQHFPGAPVDAALGSVLAQGCPHWPSVAFVLLPIHIYLFIDFYEVSLPSNPNCSCCPDHPPSHPAVCAAVCLSVTREIKTASSRTYVWSVGRDGWECRVLGQEQFGLIWARESPGVPASTVGPSSSLTFLTPYLSLIHKGRRDFGLLLPLRFLES